MALDSESVCVWRAENGQLNLIKYTFLTVILHTKPPPPHPYPIAVVFTDSMCMQIDGGGGGGRLRLCVRGVRRRVGVLT